MIKDEDCDAADNSAHAVACISYVCLAALRDVCQFGDAEVLDGLEAVGLHAMFGRCGSGGSSDSAELAHQYAIRHQHEHARCTHYLLCLSRAHLSSLLFTIVSSARYRGKPNERRLN